MSCAWSEAACDSATCASSLADCSADIASSSWSTMFSNSPRSAAPAHGLAVFWQTHGFANDVHQPNLLQLGPACMVLISPYTWLLVGTYRTEDQPAVSWSGSSDSLSSSAVSPPFFAAAAVCSSFSLAICTQHAAKCRGGPHIQMIGIANPAHSYDWEAGPHTCSASRFVANSALESSSVAAAASSCACNHELPCEQALFL